MRCIARRRGAPVPGVFGRCDDAARCRGRRPAPAGDHGTALGPCPNHSPPGRHARRGAAHERPRGAPEPAPAPARRAQQHCTLPHNRPPGARRPVVLAVRPGPRHSARGRRRGSAASRRSIGRGTVRLSGAADGSGGVVSARPDRGAGSGAARPERTSDAARSVADRGRAGGPRGRMGRGTRAREPGLDRPRPPTGRGGGGPGCWRPRGTPGRRGRPPPPRGRCGRGRRPGRARRAAPAARAPGPSAPRPRRRP